jgi:hypothetical protein
MLPLYFERKIRKYFDEQKAVEEEENEEKVTRQRR